MVSIYNPRAYYINLQSYILNLDTGSIQKGSCGMEIQRLYPVCKDYLWGGNKLKELYGKQTDCNPCAESWELSFHKDGKSLVSDGRSLAEVVTPDILGSNVGDFSFFPMLIKFIDAKSFLSVQVHPSH